MRSIFLLHKNFKIIVGIGDEKRVMNLKETDLEDLNKITNKIVHPNNKEDYQYCIKAYAFRLNKDYEKSIKMYEKALQIDKSNIDALKGIAFCYKNIMQFDKAIKYYTQIKYITPFDRAVYYELGVLEYNRKNYLRSIKNFITAIKLYPEYYDAIYALGQAHEAIEEFEMAEMIYLKIIENRPSYIIAYNRLANMYLKLAEYKRAIKYFREILAVNPEFHRSYLGIAIAFDNLGHYLEAKRYYKKYLDLKPFSEEKDYIIERLKKIYPQKNKKLTNFPHLVIVK